jgi:hypothetical protein
MEWVNHVFELVNFIGALEVDGHFEDLVGIGCEEEGVLTGREG